MKFSELKTRGSDAFGAGYYGAPRGRRIHNGFDLLCGAGDLVCSPIAGTVTKVGYPYGDDLSFRYVQVSVGVYAFRVFYVEPSVAVGDKVDTCTLIGSAQDLGERYEGIPNHVHLEIMKGQEYIDPAPFLIGIGVEV